MEPLPIQTRRHRKARFLTSTTEQISEMNGVLIVTALGPKLAHGEDEMHEDLSNQVLTKSAGAPIGASSIFGSA